MNLNIFSFTRRPRERAGRRQFEPALACLDPRAHEAEESRQLSNYHTMIRITQLSDLCRRYRFSRLVEQSASQTYARRQQQRRGQLHHSAPISG